MKNRFNGRNASSYLLLCGLSLVFITADALTIHATSSNKVKRIQEAMRLHPITSKNIQAVEKLAKTKMSRLQKIPRSLLESLIQLKSASS